MSRSNYFTGEDKFCFSCHEGLVCFNRCCRDISIYLTPYDVLRLKKRLGLSAEEFLEKYALIIDNLPNRFPFVLIKMREDDVDKRCPFLTEKGCGVYQDRPWSCRMAPVDIKGENLYGFCFDAEKCHGLNETKEWSVAEWAENQGVDLYHEKDIAFKEIPLNLSFTGFEAIDKHIKEMFLLACYQPEKFRRYIFQSHFLQEFAVADEVAKKIEKDDLELMAFAFNWLTNQFDIKKSIKIRDEVF